MPTSYYSLNKRRAIKRIKLGCFTVWKLKWLGKNDYKNKVFFRSADGKVYSPFFKQEISLCMAAIQNEKEALTKILMDIDVDIISAKHCRNRREEQIRRILKTIPENTPQNTILTEDISSFIEATDVINSYYKRELMLGISIRTKQMDDTSQSIEKITIRKDQKLVNAENEIEITKIRCYQLYELVKARISTYLMGVLKASSSTEDNLWLPLFDLDGLTNEIKIELDSFVEDKKSGQEQFRHC